MAMVKFQSLSDCHMRIFLMHTHLQEAGPTQPRTSTSADATRMPIRDQEEQSPPSQSTANITPTVRPAPAPASSAAKVSTVSCGFITSRSPALGNVLLMVVTHLARRPSQCGGCRRRFSNVCPASQRKTLAARARVPQPEVSL